MSRAMQVAKVADRDKTAGRLLKSSADTFYAPDVDVDWDAPLVEGLLFHPERRVSPYGAGLRDRLTSAQRVELGKREIVSTLSIVSAGAFFEVLLMQMLLKQVYDGVYAAVGLDPKRAWKAARANPRFQATVRHWSERTTAFLAEAGLVGRPSTLRWRRSMLMPK